MTGETKQGNDMRDMRDTREKSTFKPKIVRMKMGVDLGDGRPDIKFRSLSGEVIRGLIDDLKSNTLLPGQVITLDPEQAKELFSMKKSAFQLHKRSLIAALELEGLLDKVRVSQTRYYKDPDVKLIVIQSRDPQNEIRGKEIKRRS